MKLVQASRKEINEGFGFEYYKDENLDANEFFIDTPFGYIFTNGEGSFWKDDVEDITFKASDFNITYREMLEIVLKFKINETMDLMEEVYMHEDNIKRNIKCIEYLKQMNDIE
jgi:formylmethanofuran dehydrogenase subunit A